MGGWGLRPGGKCWSLSVATLPSKLKTEANDFVVVERGGVQLTELSRPFSSNDPAPRSWWGFPRDISWSRLWNPCCWFWSCCNGCCQCKCCCSCCCICCSCRCCWSWWWWLSWRSVCEVFILRPPGPELVPAEEAELCEGWNCRPCQTITANSVHKFPTYTNKHFAYLIQHQTSIFFHHMTNQCLLSQMPIHNATATILQWQMAAVNFL